MKRNNITKATYKNYIYQHNYWSGKDCPQLFRSGKPYKWAYFFERVGTYLEDEKKPSNSLRVGDKARLKGYIYVDSYASKKGRLYKDKEVTVTRYAGNDRKAPYLLNNGLGWARKEDLKG